jgi:hypothetical protein
MSKRLTKNERYVIADAARQILDALVRETDDETSDTYVVVNVDMVCLGFSKYDFESLKSGLSKI